MHSCLSIVIALALLSVAARPMQAQFDTTQNTTPLVQETILTRPVSFEIYISSTSVTTTIQGSSFWGSDFTSEDEVIDASFLTFGFGAHVPLLTPSPETMLFLVPAVSFGFGKTTDYNARRESSFAFDVCAPVHATFGYRKWHPSAVAFGIDGGFGINVGYRGAYQVVTVAPSLLIEATVTFPRPFGLRFMTDLTSVEIATGRSYRTWNIALVIGW